MAKEEKKKSFVLYCDYRKHLQILTDEERGKLLMAILDYAETGEEQELDGATLMAFSFITMQMDRDAKAYEKKCKSRSEAGKQGGRPRKATAPEIENAKAHDTDKKQTKAKKANGFSEKQTKAKKGDTDTDNGTDTDNDTDNDTSPLPPPEGEGKTPSTPAEPEAEDKTPYKEIVNLYHELCPSYPVLRGVSANRKKAIAARWKEYEHNLDTFRELFTKAEESKFLKGQGETARNWKADFNWLMNSENMAKVLEGKYDNTPQGLGSSFDTDDFFAAAMRRSYGKGRQEPAVTEAEAKRMKDPPQTAADNDEIRRKGEALRALLEKS